MADRHQIIVDAVGVEWTSTQRGRLYNSPQGLAVPIGATHPIWYGPLKRRFRGFPDKFGFEYAIYYTAPNKGAIKIKVPVFCTVEIKTRGDSLSVHQKRIMKMLVSFGVRCYVAKENKNDDDYTIVRWEG